MRTRVEGCPAATTRLSARRVALPLVLLAAAVVGYIAVFTAAAWYKYANFMMGFDLAVHEQVLWNTVHGRIAATSAFADTSSYFGIDIIPTELLLAPLYALAPSTYTMLLLQTVAVGLGAVPVYRLIRRRFAAEPLLAALAPWAGLTLALCYLLYLPVEYANLYEFQIRTFATTLLLCALDAFETRRPGRFWLAALLALGCRNEVGFVLAGIGAYALTDRELRAGGRRRLLFGWLPIVVGLAWVAISLGVLIPSFRGGRPSLYLRLLYGQFPDGAPWLGDGPAAILRTLATRPGFVLGELFTGERGAMRLAYLLQMFLPLAFLPLLQPRLLLITLPIFGLNLLSSTPNIHASIRYHYQALIVPFLIVGAGYALAGLLRRRPAAGRGALAGLLALSLVCNLLFRNPLMGLAARQPDHVRIAAAERLLARVPPEAALAATNTIGPHAARRERLYFFPGNVIYPREKVALGEFLLINSEEARPEGARLLAEMAASGRYRRLAEESGVSLWQRVR